MTENKAPQALDVTVKNYEGVAALSPVGTFVFCILCFASVSYTHLTLPTNSRV